jgi:hypothetical protein
MSQRKKILFFTNSEYGQCNVVLATAYELVLRGCEVHIASFAPLHQRVVDLNNGVYASLPSGSQAIIFHQIDSPSMVEMLIKRFGADGDLTHGVGLREALRMYSLLTQIVCGWDGDEYIRGCESCAGIIRTVEPDVIVNERACMYGMEACSQLGRNFVLLSPNTFLETVGSIQPWGFGFWGLPA